MSMQSSERDPAELRREMEELAGHAAREYAEDEGFERRPARIRRWGLLLVLSLAAAAVAAWNVHDVRSAIPPLPTAEQERALVGVVTVLAHQIEAVRRATGAYPASLDAVAPPLEGVTYRRTQGGYALEAVADDVVVRFESDQIPPLVTERRSPGGGELP